MAAQCGRRDVGPEFATVTRMIKKDSPWLMSSFFHILQAGMESKTCFEKSAQKSIGMPAEFRPALACPCD